MPKTAAGSAYPKKSRKGGIFFPLNITKGRKSRHKSCYSRNKHRNYSLASTHTLLPFSILFLNKKRKTRIKTIEEIRNTVFPKIIREISVDITPITPLILFSLFSIAFIKITENIAVITNSTPSEYFVRAPPIIDPRVTDKTQ